MTHDPLKSRFLRHPRIPTSRRLARHGLGVLFSGIALAAGELLRGSQPPIALICTFAVLISALAGGDVAGWLCLGITGVGFWFVRQPTGNEFSSQLTVWCAYVALGMVLVEVIRHLQQERRKLLEQDQRLRLASRAARIWFWEWDLKHNILRWSREKDVNDSKAQFYEFPLEEYIKRRVHPEDRGRILTALSEAAARGHRFELEYRIIEEDGSLRWLSTKGKIFESNGSSAMLGMASEITEQKLANEVRSHHRAVLGSMIEGVCYVDTSGAIQYINAAAERLLGYDSQEIHGRDFHGLVHVDCPQNGRPCCLLQAMRSEHSCHVPEETLTTKSGERFSAEYTAAPVKDGINLGAVITFRDISERKRVEAALRSSEKMAATGRIAATISHELRNPLDSVMQLLYLLKQSPRLGDIERQQFGLIEQELHRMTEVAQQTLAMHRQSSSMVPINVAKLIDGVLLLYGKKIRSQKIQIERRYEWEGEIPGFPAELRQVFTNLIVNAVEAMPHGGRLRVHVRADREPSGQMREGVLVTLLDSGSGIPKNARVHLFEPFFTTKGEKGSGVGLWVSRGIVNRHSGRIHVHSDDRPGRSYTCFSVFLPQKQPLSLAPAPPIQQPGGSPVAPSQPPRVEAA
jgi:PAS domain S-box-containing protein